MRITTTEYGNIWFTSDWHLGHNKEFLYSPRGCTGRDEHVKWLIEQINELVEPDDLIINMGDVSLTSTFEQLVSWLLQIKCKNMMLIRGNHENNMKRFFDLRYQVCNFNNGPVVSDELEELINTKNIKDLGQYRELTIVEPTGVPNEKARRYAMTLCHFPMLLWNNCQHGTWNLCGHSHGNLIPSHPACVVAKRLDCGVDNALTWSEGEQVMFDWEDVKNIMSKKEIEFLDHHDRSTT